MSITTLQEYLRSVYSRRLGAKSLSCYAAAAKNFDMFIGKSIPSANVGEATVGKFRAWLITRGYAESSATTLVKQSRAMLREWFPGAPWRNKTFRYGDQLGTLEYVFLKQFAPCRRIAKHTRRRYGAALGLFSEQLGRPATVGDLCSRRVSAFLRWLATAHGLASWTIANHAQRIGAIWRWAAQARLVKAPPTWIATA